MLARNAYIHRLSRLIDLQIARAKQARRDEPQQSHRGRPVKQGLQQSLAIAGGLRHRSVFD